MMERSTQSLTRQNLERLTLRWIRQRGESSFVWLWCSCPIRQLLNNTIMTKLFVKVDRALGTRQMKYLQNTIKNEYIGYRAIGADVLPCRLVCLFVFAGWSFCWPLYAVYSPPHPIWRSCGRSSPWRWPSTSCGGSADAADPSFHPPHRRRSSVFRPTAVSAGRLHSLTEPVGENKNKSKIQLGYMMKQQTRSHSSQPSQTDS